MDILLLFFGSIIGVFNALILVFYFFFLSEKSLTNRLIGAIALLFCIRVGISCFYFFLQTVPPLVIQTGLMSQFLIGPFVYAYCYCAQKNSKVLPKPFKYLILGSALFIFTFGVIYSFNNHFEIWDHKIRYLIHAYLIIFLVISLTYVKEPFGKFISKSKYYSSVDKLSLLVYLTALFICLGFAISLYTNYLLGPITASVIFHFSLFWYTLKLKKKTKAKYHDKKITELDAKHLISKFEELVINEQLYKDPNIKLRLMAKKIGTTPNKLSQILNDNLGISFNNFINQYRVQEAKRLLLNNELFSIEGIGKESGFASKSSFYKVFKENTRYTPLQYKKSIKITG